jgi:hypothetical protein
MVVRPLWSSKPGLLAEAAYGLRADEARQSAGVKLVTVSL